MAEALTGIQDAAKYVMAIMMLGSSAIALGVIVVHWWRSKSQ